jgi:hypothetical protein
MSLDVLGGLCVVTAVVGGGLEIAGVVRIAHLSGVKLIALGLIGVAFIAISKGLITDHHGSRPCRHSNTRRGRGDRSECGGRRSR